MLNRVWTGLFLIAFATGAFRFLIQDDPKVLGRMMEALFEMAKTGFEISLGLTGVLALWLGILRIGEQAGAVSLLTRLLTPLFRRLMPQVPSDHPALGAITMNLAANALGLDNAATPLGIQAMRELQALNPKPDTLSDAQILFLVINTSAVTLVPVAVFTYRAQLGAANPTDVFLPILLATYCSTLVGLLAVATVQKLKLFDPVVLAYLLGLGGLIAGIAIWLSGMDQDTLQQRSAQLSHFLLLGIIAAFLIAALVRGVNAFDAFVEGAKEGFQTAVTIIPYLVAMLAAVGLLRASGALDLALDGLRGILQSYSVESRFLDALPTALMKPFSGSGARAMMIDAMHTHGPDSLAGRMTAIMQGSTETTFYVLAVYCGAVGIRNVRHALGCGLLADGAGLTAAILIAYWFFG
ncbi:MAG: spore maturation protein [Methylothermaceae bacterium]|nr:spore maturation protein [Methylothermaceae bacterium]